MSSARKEWEKRKRKRLGNNSQRHADTIGAAEQADGGEISQPTQDENIELKGELAKHDAAAQRERGANKRFPERHIEV